MRVFPLAFSLLLTAAGRSSTGDVRFRVLDAEDHPIVGAVALPDLLGIDTSEPTDAQGWGVLRARSGRLDLSVVAPHFKLATASIVVGQATPTIIHLEKANALELILQRDDGTSSTHAVVQFRTEGTPVFPENAGGAVGWWRQKYSITGGTCGSGHASNEGRPEEYSVAVHPGEDGRIVLEDVRPDQKITIDVVDEIATALVPSFTVEVGKDEHARVAKTIDGPLQDVVIQVKDEHGAGVPGARVRVEALVRARTALSLSGIATRKTDESGTCRITNIRSAHASITIKKAGYSAWYRADVAIGAGDASIECILTRSDGG